MTQHCRMRWYNPKLRNFERREMPDDDGAALALLEGYPHAEADAKIYREWRELGATVTAALLRSGESARERDTA